MRISQHEAPGDERTPALAAADEVLRSLPPHELRYALAWLLARQRDFRPALAGLGAVRAAKQALAR